MAGEFYTRRNLPHWYMPSATHFVTLRLADTLPKHVLADLQERKAASDSTGHKVIVP